jgi:Condensation domain
MTSAYPASPGQQRHWEYQRSHPESAAFNMTVALRLSGTMQPSCARQALLRLLGQHEALRVTFAERDGRLVQQPQPADEVSWQALDLSALEPGQRYTRLRELGAAEAGRPFDLCREPVTRLLLIRIGPAEHVLLMNVHHIAFDGWSLTVSLEELAAGYQAALAGRPDPAAPLPLQYRDFCRHQWAAAGSAQWRGQLGYWRHQLADPPPAVRWPGRPSGAPVPAACGEVCWGLIPAGLPGAVAVLARQLRATPYIVQLAAYFMLLRAWTGRDELCVGVPSAGRSAVAYERIAGFFVNTLALRAHIGGDQLVAEVIGAVREAFLAAYRHGDVPFGIVLDELAAGPGPLFQTMFILHNEIRPAPPWGDVAVQQTILATGQAKYDLTVSLEAREQTLAIDAEYRVACLDRDSVAHLLGSYVALLQAVTAGPDRRADEVSRMALSHPAILVPPRQPAGPATGALFRGPVADWRPGRDAVIIPPAAAY